MQNEFEQIGEGLIHRVYRKRQFAYKIVKEDMPRFNTANHFLREIRTCNWLKNIGLSVIMPEDSYYDEYFERFALKEPFINGKCFNETNIPSFAVDRILNFLGITSKLQAPAFGDIFCEPDISHSTWETVWKKYIIQAHCVIDLFPESNKAKIKESIAELQDKKYCGKPYFLVMDPNPNNFIFHDENSFTAIDLDHPIGGDPLWQWACVKWFKPQWFPRLFSLGIVNKKDETEIEKLSVLFGLTNVFFNVENNLDISFAIQKVIELLNVQKE